MKHNISRYLLTLVALFALTAGAWADPNIKAPVISGDTQFFESVTVTMSCTSQDADIYYTLDGSDPRGDHPAQIEYKNAFTLTETTTIKATSFDGNDWSDVVEVTFTKVQGPEVTFNEAKTEASFNMPAFDATADYELVRDITQKVDVEVRIDGTATERIRIAKDGDGHYKFVTKQYGWQFAAVDKLDNNKDLTNGELNYTFKMKEGNDYVAKNFDTNLCPGTWRLEATANAEKPYEGTAYGKDITLFEGYDLTLNSPQVSSVAVTIGDAAVTPQEGGRIPDIEKDKSVKLSVSEGYMFSDMFTGYKVSFTPAGDALAWNKVGCYYWGNYGNNNIFNPVEWPGVEMTKNGNIWETTVNANGLTNIIFNDYQTNNQQTSDLPFASGAADDLGSYTIADAVEMTYNTAKTEATFSIPANDVALNFSVKRNLASNVTVDMLTDRIRIKKEGDLYVPVDEFQLVPTVKDVINAQNPVILEPNKDYTIAFQKKDGEGWADIQTFSVGQFRMVVMGAGEYGGTNYSTEFQLFEGYEVEVAAGEYATYYCADAVEVEGDDAELYTIANVTESEAQLSEAIKVAPKETPLLVFNKGTEAKKFLLIPTTATADEVSVAKEFRGTLEEKEMPASSATRDFYVCTGKEFMWVRDAGVIAANRCWLQIGDQPAAARAMTRSIVGGGNTTGINAVDSGELTGDSYYDLQGRKVEKPNRKGIYIHNGRKVVLK